MDSMNELGGCGAEMAISTRYWPSSILSLLFFAGSNRVAHLPPRCRGRVGYGYYLRTDSGDSTTAHILRYVYR